MFSSIVRAGVPVLVFLIFKLMPTAGYAATPISNHPQFKQAVQAYREGQIDEAEKLWKSLLHRYPRRPAILNNLAVIAADRGDTETAIQILDSILFLNQSIRSAYDNLSSIYSHLAAEAYRRALALDSGKPQRLRLILVDQETESARPIDKMAHLDRILSSTIVDTPFVKEPSFPRPLERPGLHADIATMLKAWVHAWGQQDVSSYMSSYVRDYHPRGLTHKEWYEKRAERLTTPEFIEIRFSDLKIQEYNEKENSAVVVFLQSYRSNQLKSTVRKKLVVKKVLGVWKIADERVVR